jgi:hypothetical protein
LIYSDPTGLTTLSELNATMEVSNILDSIRGLSTAYLRQYASDRVKGIVSDITIRLLQQMVPSFPGLSAITNFGRAGLQFEDLVTRGICGVIGDNYVHYLDSLWFEAKVRTNGMLASNGFHCGDVNNDLGGARVNARGGVKAPRPDFIIKSGAPEDTDPVLNPGRNFNKALLIGDFKITVKAARRSVEKNTTQWQAILAYATYNNGHQYAPVTLFFTFLGNKNSAADIAYIKGKALAGSNNVTAFVTEIVSRI